MTERDAGTPPQKPDDRLSPSETARALMRRSLKASLATLDASTGHPYASLVTIATDVDATPVFLISTLALHTRNIASDARASLLFDGTDASGDPLAGGRVTVVGRAVKTQRPLARERFLARQPGAQGYADFPDFAFYELEIERAHFIGGFGRIVDIGAGDLLLETSDATDLIAAHADVVSHMNDDHAAAIELYATEIARAPSGPWQLAGLDPEGFDMTSDGQACRVAFAVPVLTADGARREFIRLAAVARERKSQRQ